MQKETLKNFFFSKFLNILIRYFKNEQMEVGQNLVTFQGKRTKVLKFVPFMLYTFFCSCTEYC
jgi:hypothetical protein